MPHRQIAEVRVHPAPHRCHNVKFYEHDRELIETLGRHIGNALECGDTAIVIATRSHRDGLAEELRLRKINVSPALKAGRFIELDAAKTLENFMVGVGRIKRSLKITLARLFAKPLPGSCPAAAWLLLARWSLSCGRKASGTQRSAWKNSGMNSLTAILLIFYAPIPSASLTGLNTVSSFSASAVSTLM
jgi:hypothetical protein